VQNAHRETGTGDLLAKKSCVGISISSKSTSTSWRLNDAERREGGGIAVELLDANRDGPPQTPARFCNTVSKSRVQGHSQLDWVSQERRRQLLE